MLTRDSIHLGEGGPIVVDDDVQLAPCPLSESGSA